MNRNFIVGLGVVVVAGLLLLFVIVPALQPAGTGSEMNITFYDEDGNELGKATTIGLFGLGIRTSGFEGDIHSVKVAVSFEVTTTMDYVAMYTYCYLQVVTEYNMQYSDIVHDVAKHQMDSSKIGLTGTFEATYLMSNLLPASAIDDLGKTEGWKMSFLANVETTLDLEDGTQRDTSDACSIILYLTWFEDVLSVDSWFAPPVIG